MTVSQAKESSSSADDSQNDLEAARFLAQAYVQLQTEMGKVIVGQQRVIEEILIAIFSRGHCLMQGVPGLAKTLLVSTLAQAMDLSFHRIQFTPDLMPSDISGTDILQEDAETGRRKFEFSRGPVFANLLLADEINRTPPKTQAALLQAMQERQVTAGNHTFTLPDPFFVLATQNPIEQEGTYPLPEAQLDRFLLKIKVGYPDMADERVVLERHHAATEATGLADTAIEAAPFAVLAQARREIRAVRVEAAIFEYLLAVVRRTREWPAIALGASPRAGTSLLLVAKAMAAREGRDFVVPDDVKEAALPVLRHRLVLRPEAELEGLDADRVVSEVLAATAVPK
jgi:MoxR-like ATPase